MSYTPTTWANGDIITAQKMNNIEQGIVDASSGGVVVVSGELDAGGTTFTLDKTYNELKALLLSGAVVVQPFPNGADVALYTLANCYLYNGTYYALFTSEGYAPGGSPETFVLPYATNSADGYPAFED